MKRRYGKVFAYFFFAFANGCILYPLAAIMMFVISSKQGEAPLNSTVIALIVWTIISIIMTILFTKHLNKHTPKEERVATWFRAWWLGLRITFKISLFFTLIFIPAALAIPSKISEKDVYLWEDGDIVFGDNGKEYTVAGFGGFVNDGLVLRKIHINNGEAYFEDGLNKIWLKQRR